MNQKMKFTKYLKLLRPFELTFFCFSIGWIATSLFVNFYVMPNPAQASLSANESSLSLATLSDSDGDQEEESQEHMVSMPMETETEPMADDHILNSIISPNASATRLNQAFLYPEAAASNNGMESWAGRIYKEMTLRESGWLSEVYSLSGMTPAQMAAKIGKPAPANPAAWIPDHWTRAEVLFQDGDGNVIQGGSNVKEIMSMANVYACCHDPNDYDSYTNYIRRLWEASHHLDIQMSDIYYCGGCQQQTGGTAKTAEGGEAAEETGFPEYITSVEGPDRDLLESRYIASLSEAKETPGQTDAPKEEERTAPSCPGHVDLKVTATIAGLDEAGGLYSLDAAGGGADSFNENWQGWTEVAKGQVAELQSQDWYERYGLTTEGISLANPLTDAQVEAYIRELPAGLSQDRMEVIRFALNSVGRVPYYWGGKPSAGDYDGNFFATVAAADDRGRMLRGLDCSGWVQWVYWSAIGKELPCGGTEVLAGLGKGIDRDQLQPGDIMVKTGENSHVVMFLGWEKDGKAKCIHETGGGINNVIINEINPNYPCCRNLLDG